MTSEAIAGFTQEQGMFELSMLNAETSEAEFEEVIIEGIKRGIPTEILTRLKELWEMSKEVAGEAVAIGKIIVMAIIEFIKANPMITVGLILGAAVSTLVLGIPFGAIVVASLNGYFSIIWRRCGRRYARRRLFWVTAVCSNCAGKEIFRTAQDDYGGSFG